MDSFLVDYLRSGSAWLLVGSGPSNAMGHPSWRQLAQVVIDTIRTEQPQARLRAFEAALASNDFPRVFDLGRETVGGQRLLQILNAALRPSRIGEIYQLIAQWPIPVYLTTNYDDELATHLSALGVAYISDYKLR